MDKKLVTLIVMSLLMVSTLTVLSMKTYLSGDIEKYAGTIKNPLMSNNRLVDTDEPFFNFWGKILKNETDINELYFLGCDPDCMDIDGDGDIDIVAADSRYNNWLSGLSILYNMGNLTFERKKLSIIVGGGYESTGAECINLADYDNDGDIDIMVTVSEKIQGIYYVNGTVYLLRNEGNGEYDAEKILFFPGTQGNPDNWIHPHIASADFDRDGDVDFILTSNSGYVVLYKNDGTGRFSHVKTIYKYDTPCWGIASADFDDDGWPDFVLAVNRSVYIHFNNRKIDCFDCSSGVMLGPTNVFLDFVMGDLPFTGAVAPIDYNKDGLVDFVLGVDIGALSIWINQGDGTFKPFFAGIFPGICGMASGDIDGDGYTDIIMDKLGPYLLLNNRTYVTITRPHQPPDVAVYFKGKRLTFWPNSMFDYAIAICNITFEAEGLKPLERVEFYLDGELVENDTSSPYEWEWGYDLTIPRMHTIEVIGYDKQGNMAGKYTTKIFKIL